MTLESELGQDQNGIKVELEKKLGFNFDAFEMGMELYCGTMGPVQNQGIGSDWNRTGSVGISIDKKIMDRFISSCCWGPQRFLDRKTQNRTVKNLRKSSVTLYMHHPTGPT